MDVHSQCESLECPFKSDLEWKSTFTLALGGCSSGGNAVTHGSEGHWFDPGTLQPGCRSALGRDNKTPNCPWWCVISAWKVKPWRVDSATRPKMHSKSENITSSSVCQFQWLKQVDLNVTRNMCDASHLQNSSRVPAFIQVYKWMKGCDCEAAVLWSLGCNVGLSRYHLIAILQTRISVDTHIDPIWYQHI